MGLQAHESLVITYLITVLLKYVVDILTRQGPPRVPPKIVRIVWPGTGSAAVALLAAAALVLLYGVKLWRRLAPRWCAERRLPILAYRAALDRLAESGRRRGFGETREAFATASAGFSPAFAELTRRHLEATLGARSRPTHRGDYLVLMALVTTEVSRSTAWPRRLLGALDPFAWLRVR